MTATPTADEFMTHIDVEDDDLEPTPAVVPPAAPPAPVTPGALDPGLALASVVSSLEVIAQAFTAAAGFAEERTELGAERDGLREQLADLEAKHGVLLGALADVQKAVRPSTSKLAHAVRDALKRWTDPEPAAELDDPRRSGAVQCEACARLFADQELLDNHQQAFPDSSCAEVLPTAEARPDPFPQPATDAEVDEWRAFACQLRPGDAATFASMNRSQIRTALGIAHS
jgi:hypothetical protein